MKDYLLFVDETKPDMHHPNFCFAGIAVERTYYEKLLIKNINDLKIKHFGKSDVIFHFSDMKKNRGEFSVLLDETRRKNFWEEYVYLLNNSDFDILGVYFNDEKNETLTTWKIKN